MMPTEQAQGEASILYAEMSTEHPDVTVLVPALNEEETIGEVVDRLLALPIDAQIIVVNDGSDDRTGEILHGYGDEILVLTNRTRGGKGAAIRQALPYAKGRTVIVQDADLEYSPEEIPKLIEPILQGKAKVVYGTRFAHGLAAGMALPNKIVNRLLRLAVRILFGQKITDEATCYKAFDTDLLKSMNLECVRFEFCPEVTAKSCRLGQKIFEIPISYTPRTKEAGKKIRWTDAPDAFWTLLKHRFKRFK
ncbi:MAG TPA: glycosyltransferase family 2 protein [Fimbriimonadaceae bacterium]|nr:glycosyltransferase family 2 protein [Fimbriimonadaceae bacterium]